MQGADIDLGLQLQNHKTIVARISNMLGGVQQASQHLNECLYYVNIGSNDYINNYFLPQFYSSSRVYNPTQYAQDLIDRLSQSIRVFSYVTYLKKIQKRHLLMIIIYNSWLNCRLCIMLVQEK